MKRKKILTAIIGALGMFFFLAAAYSGLEQKFLLEVFGILVFIWAAYRLYAEHRVQREEGFFLPRQDEITKIELINDAGDVLASWDLYQRVSVLIGKNYKENLVDIDLSRSEYRSLVDFDHAVLNFADGAWYVEDLGSKNGVIVQKAADSRKYKLSSDQPCRLEYGDLVLIGMCKLILR